jgi:Tol biopolymer transport system component
MALGAGTRLGPYEIVSAIGAGGMGEVYRARDTRLERTVAIKVLPIHLSDNAELKQRLEREARTISSLNHPHICTLYDVGHQDGTDFLVMEFLEGETLAERLRRGPLPLPELLKIGSEIADALDKAHRAGIVHRDLKPANVMLTKSGCKLLDFGLAKEAAMSAAAGAAPLVSAAVTMDGPSPQLSPLTTHGAIVGTIQYMSPEQIEGKEADGRSDIFALGAVLYEMAAGKRAFEGKSQLSTATAILEKEPEPLSATQPTSRPALEHCIRTCLVKDRESRRQSARDVLQDLQWIAKDGAQLGRHPASAKAPGRTWVLAAVAAAGILIVAAIAWRLARPANAPVPVMRFTIAVPAGESLGGSWYQPPGIALSGDGMQLAFVAHHDGISQLFLRSLSDVTARPVAGTEGAHTPFFSPDGRWLGFYSSGKLMKVAMAGGPPVAVATPPEDEIGVSGAFWAANDTIYFGSGKGVFKVPAGGGSPVAVTKLDPRNSEIQQGFPQLLPGGKALLFVVRTTEEASVDNADIWAVTLATAQRKLVIKSGTDPHFTRSGHLVFLRAGVLFAVAFDAERLEVKGEATPIVENVRENPRVGAGQFSIADDGSLVYVPGGVSFGEHELVMVDKSGKTRSLTANARPYEDFSISPDGRFIATTIEGSVTDTWIHNIARDTDSRFTFGVEHRDPCWTPDGTRITYSGYKDGKDALFWKPVDGNGPEELLVTSDTDAYPWFWSRDGRILLYSKASPSGSAEVWALSMPDRTTRPILQSQFDDEYAIFSPDGKWIAYNSNESGRDEVYVMPFPSLSPRTRVSTNGGRHPLFSPDGRQLYYRSGTSLEAMDQRALAATSRVMAVSIDTKSGLNVGAPRALFEGPFFDSGHDWAITPDGNNFLFIRDKATQAAPAEMNVVLNWFEELKRRIPSK